MKFIITLATKVSPVRQDRMKKLVDESLFTIERKSNSLIEARNSAESIEQRRKYLEQNGSGNQPDSNSNLPMKSLPEGLPADLRRYAEDIQERLKFTKGTPGLQGAIDKYNGLNWILKTMALENSGYLVEYEDKEEVVEEISKLLADIDFDYETSKYLDSFVDFLLRRTKQLKNWYWRDKTSLGHCRSVLLLSWLWKTLHDEVERAYNLIVSFGYSPSDPIASIDAFSDAGHKEKPGNKGLEIKNHILMDGTKAGKLYQALVADDVRWLVDDMDENSFVNRLTAPEGPKIKLHNLNQVYFITRNYIFPPEEGKTVRRITTEEWGLIRQVFDVEDGDMNRVNQANKSPRNHKKVEKYMDAQG